MLWLLLLLAGLIGYGLSYLWRILPVAGGYRAKVVCTAVFACGRDLGQVLAEDAAAGGNPVLRFMPVRVDWEARSVTASWFGLRPRTVVSRPAERATAGKPWAEAEGRLDVSAAFAEPDPRKLRRTRAVVVVHDGRIVAERYAPGFSEETPLAGWSMTKSVLSALVGVLVARGRLSLSQKLLLPEWSGAGDPRRDISLDDLLRMRSGLAFEEKYSSPLGDVAAMLFTSPGAGAYAAAKPLSSKPGTAWAYSSGTSNVISRVMRQGMSPEEYLRFPRQALFDRIGMRSAVMEADAEGEFVGSSFMVATARDWARFGLLYAQDGVWEGERILPQGWVEYSTRPTPESSGRYGAHWWLRLHRELGGQTEAASRLPTDAFYALGHEGQTISVIPSKKMVVVRLGCSAASDAWDQAAFLTSILKSIG
ncbi:MAG: serine hydrolase [Elusimicrobiota bacterium]